MNSEVSIAKKYYNELHFDEKYNEEFDKIINEYKDVKLSQISFDELMSKKDNRLNLIWELFNISKAEEKYKEKNIPEDIFLDTMSDIKLWTDKYYNYSGSLGLEEMPWLQRHINFTIFRLGRLQFAIGKSEVEDKENGLFLDDDILEVHIPSGGRLSREEIVKSFDMSKKFFKEYFPLYKYQFYTCESWLLGRELNDILKPDSNILGFQKMFTITKEIESEDIIRYTFGWKKKREDVKNLSCNNSMQKTVKEYIDKNKKFHLGYGYIKADVK